MWLSNRAFVLVVAGVTTPNPTVVGAAHLFDRPGVVRGILGVTRNSFLWGVGLWSLAHVATTGDLASVLMFGSIRVLGLLGALLLDAKKAARHGVQWQEFAAATSSVPFLAIAQRRQRLVVAEIGWWRIALAALVFLIALYAHDWVWFLKTSFARTGRKEWRGLAALLMSSQCQRSHRPDKV